MIAYKKEFKKEKKKKKLSLDHETFSSSNYISIVVEWPGSLHYNNKGKDSMSNATQLWHHSHDDIFSGREAPLKVFMRRLKHY